MVSRSRHHTRTDHDPRRGGIVTTIETTQGVRAVPSVDVAGVPWPAYKVHALVVGILATVVLVVATRSAEITVLAAAAITTVTWWTLRFAHLRV
jgi:hypothetical protein